MKVQKIALYRKYRPDNLDDILGQDHIVRILKNALLEDKVSHAYLFSGPRGTGKTSVARILAKSLNCATRDKHHPCGKCEICKSAKEGTTMDVIEIDAASNRGIDEIRDLREKIKFAPTNSAYKIFIIDEVHMLTKEAFNALLKTLEEPPAHAFFVLATTELNKVPSTILSRCQRHDFKRIKLTEIVNKLTEISKKEKIKISEDGINLIAEASEGGMRDAISVLDQLASTNIKEITVDEIIDIIGIAPYKKVYKFVDSLLKKKTEAALKTIISLEKSNSDLIVFTKSAQELVSKILMAKVGGIDQVEGTKEQLESIQKLSNEHDLSLLVELSEEIVECQKNFRSGVDPSFVLSILGIKFSNRYSNLTEVQDKPEIQIQNKIINKTDDKQKIKKSQTQDKRTNGQWHHFLMEVKSKNNTLHAFLRVANPEFGDDSLTLIFPYRFHKEKLEESKNRRLVEEIIAKIYGQQYEIRCILDGNGGNGKALADTSVAASILGGELIDD
jgi:DNA polymerase III subunit gamma/tau